MHKWTSLTKTEEVTQHKFPSIYTATVSRVASPGVQVDQGTSKIRSNLCITNVQLFLKVECQGRAQPRNVLPTPIIRIKEEKPYFNSWETN